jgi:hypothetical protein
MLNLAEKSVFFNSFVFARYEVSDLITQELLNVEPNEELDFEEIMKRIILSVMLSESLKLESHKLDISSRSNAEFKTSSPYHIKNVPLGLNTKLFDNNFEIISFDFEINSSFSFQVTSFILARFHKSFACNNGLLFFEKSRSLYIL